MFTLAWRNIWRNKRRTFITAASVLSALLFALITRSMQIGTYSKMVDNLLQAYTGYIQVQNPGYWENKDINKSFPVSDTLIRAIGGIRNVKEVVPRLEYFALASFGLQAKASAVVGIAPEREERMTHLTKWIRKGKYLSRSDSGVLVASKLAGYLRLNVGDTLVLLGQGFHGVSAAGKFPVRGILRFPSPDLDGQMIYMPLELCQEFFGAGSRVTSLAVDLRNADELDATIRSIGEITRPLGLKTMAWQEMLVELVQYIKTDNASGLIMLAILYMVVAFGVFGTVVMMTSERIREFGIMVSIGMKKRKLAFVALLEMLMIGALGIFAGAVFSLPIIAYYYHHPLYYGGQMGEMIENYGFEAKMYFALQPDFYIAQSLIVAIIVLGAACYPMVRIFRMKEIKALRK